MNRVFDIETGPQPIEDVIKFKPEFEAPGNIKDPAKIAAALFEKEQKWRSELALSPITGKVLIIGIKHIGGEISYLEGDEKSILERFWQVYALSQDKGNVNKGLWIGHYTHMFDLLFIIRRSWTLGVKVPPEITKVMHHSDHWENLGFIDTVKIWQLRGQNPDDKYIKLGLLAEWLGVGKKNGDGADFAELYAKDREAALKYLDNDLILTEGVALKLIPNLP